MRLEDGSRKELEKSERGATSCARGVAYCPCRNIQGRPAEEVAWVVQLSDLERRQDKCGRCGKDNGTLAVQGQEGSAKLQGVVRRRQDAPGTDRRLRLLFKTEYKYRHKGEVLEDAERVIIRMADFATAPKVRKQLRAYLESSDRRDPDLAKRLPEVITKLRPEQLRVCELANSLIKWHFGNCQIAIV